MGAMGRQGRRSPPSSGGFNNGGGFSGSSGMNGGMGDRDRFDRMGGGMMDRGGIERSMSGSGLGNDFVSYVQTKDGRAPNSI